MQRKWSWRWKRDEKRAATLIKEKRKKNKQERNRTEQKEEENALDCHTKRFDCENKMSITLVFHRFFFHSFVRLLTTSHFPFVTFTSYSPKTPSVLIYSTKAEKKNENPVRSQGFVVFLFHFGTEMPFNAHLDLTSSQTNDRSRRYLIYKNYEKKICFWNSFENKF